jgi:hypothetical protein
MRRAEEKCFGNNEDEVLHGLFSRRIYIHIDG